MSTVIIDYGSGNLHSAQKAFERVARERGHAGPILVSSRADDIRAADRIVLPGVGAFADCRRGLNALPDLAEALSEAVRDRGRPFLGICVGMQLMATRGLEHEVTAGFDWIPGDVRVIKPADPALKIPHMGWNRLRFHRAHPLTDGLERQGGGFAYFVHSYHLACAEPRQLVADTDHGGPVTAFVADGNVAGAQFHPEKSQALGLALIGNFLGWRP